MSMLKKNKLVLGVLTVLTVIICICCVLIYKYKHSQLSFVLQIDSKEVYNLSVCTFARSVDITDPQDIDKMISFLGEFHFERSFYTEPKSGNEYWIIINTKNKNLFFEFVSSGILIENVWYISENNYFEPLIDMLN